VPGDDAAIATTAIPNTSAGQMRNAAKLSKGEHDGMIQSVMDGLEANLKTNPVKFNRWNMLMRSRMQLGVSGGRQHDHLAHLL
jgi:cytochrome c-type biogenesis protein CcmH